MILKTYYRNHTAKLIRRTTHNNTHKNIVDDSIEEIQCYKINTTKHRLYIALSIFTLGVINIISRIFPIIYLKLVCNLSEVHDSSYFLITEKDKTIHLVESQLESFYSRNYLLSENFKGKKMNFKKDIIDSKYLGHDYHNKTEEIIVIYIIHYNIFNSIIIFGISLGFQL